MVADGCCVVTDGGSCDCTLGMSLGTADGCCVVTDDGSCDCTLGMSLGMAQVVAAWSLMTGLVTVLLACHWAWPCSVLDVRFRASKGTEEDLHIFFYTYFFWKYVFNLKIARTNITFVVSPLSDLMN